MQLNNETYRRKTLEAMPTEQLSSMLREELGKESGWDAELVRLLMELLEARTEAAPEKYERDEAAAEAANEKFRACWNAQEPRKRKRKVPAKTWLLRVASIAVVIGVLFFAVPSVSGQNNFLEFVTKITDDVVGFFSPDQTDNRGEYIFKTDHPGLQQVYDTVTGYGITDPVVPSRLSLEYELVQLETTVYPAKTRVTARLEAGKESIVFYYDLYGTTETHEYLRDDTPDDVYECAGIIHNIYYNQEKYFVLWERDNLKCSIVVDCQEGIIEELLDSIYMMEA